MKRILPLTLLLATISAAAPPAGTHWRLAFADKFDGSSLNTSKWSYRTGPRLCSERRAAERSN
jgi:hypothetical protein